MTTIDQQFVEYIVKTLVNNPDKVSVSRITDERGVLLTLSVDPSDTGRVIGRAGATAQSIRALLRALGNKNQAHYNLKIVENGQTVADDQPEAEASVSESDMVAQTRAELSDVDEIDI